MTEQERNTLILSLSAFVREALSLDQPAQNDPATLGTLLRLHGLLDSSYYLARYEDVAKRNLEPVWHYPAWGFNENRFPGPWLEELAGCKLAKFAMQAENVPVLMQQLLAYLLSAGKKNGPDIRIVRQGAYESLYDLPLYVHWTITSRCNFRCSYCSYFFADRHDCPDPDPGQLFAAVDKLAALNRPAYQFVLLGGEPTVSPRLPDLIDYLDSSLGERLAQVVIVTNGSRKAEYFNRFADLGRRAYFQIMTSLHLESMKPEQIYELVRQIDPSLELNLLLMAHPEKLELVRGIFEQLCELRKAFPFHLVIQPIYQLPGFVEPDPRYPDEFFRWRDLAQQRFAELHDASPAQWQKTAPQFANLFWEISEDWQLTRLPAGDRMADAARGWLNFRDMHCASGAHVLRIEEDGRLLGTTCGLADTGLNIYRDELDEERFMRVIRCPKTLCACSDNDLLMKFADEQEAARFLEQARKRQQFLKKLRWPA